MCSQYLSLARPAYVAASLTSVPLRQSHNSADHHQPAREQFVRSYLHLLAQEAYFFEDETWEVLGMQQGPGNGTNGHDCSERLHVYSLAAKKRLPAGGGYSGGC
jgi:hypothetical protein